MSIVSCKHSELPPLTDKQKTELKSLSAQPESKIDYSDIGEPTQPLWNNAVRGQFYRPVSHSQN